MMYFKYCLPVLISIVLVGCSNTDENGLPDEEIVPVTSGFVPCENGFAGEYPCSGYDLLSTISLQNFNAEAGNDCWGWTDSFSGTEYALMGLDNGIAFVNVSEGAAPVYLGKLPTRTNSSPWRDVKVYGNYAFVVSEAPNHGLQVFDLTKLRGVTAVQTFTADAENLDFGSAHNIVINEAQARAYVVGADTFNGGPHIIDISNPLLPVTLGGYFGDGYTHDAQVVTYSGPDTDYTNVQLFVGSNENSITLVDLSDAQNPRLISKIAYSNTGYTHQGWFSEDQTYFIANDELDELSFGFNTRSLIFDFSDLDNPQQIGTYFGPTKAIDHNYYVNGQTLFLSNYSAGLREINIADISNGNFTETGFFDTYPATDNTSFNGAWSNYPYFESGNILVSDIERGLFIIKKSQ